MMHKAGSAKRALGGGLVLGLLLAPRAALAWTFPEHQRISETAIRLLVTNGEKAPPGRKTVPERWIEFRSSIDPALPICAEGYQKRKDEAWNCIPSGALPALAGDHACTPVALDVELRDDPDWMFDVLGVADKTWSAFQKPGADTTDREAARRAMHIDLQGVDDQYVSRAMIDYSHFQAPRESPGTDLAGLRAYLEVALAPNAQSNATAAYVNYHVAALRLAAAARFDPERKVAYLTRAFLAEAFAAHFLEDSFAAGHFVGHWGDTATRLGSHDYYSGAGYQASRWSKPGTTYMAHGDAFLSDVERETAARAVSASLFQVVVAATDDDDARRLVASFTKGFALESYDSCQQKVVVPGLRAFASVKLITAVLKEEPVPAAREPEVPRMRAENGGFFGAGATVGLGWVGVEEALNSRVMAGVRGGYGAAGLVNDPLNAQLFLESGFIGQRLYDGHGTSVTGFYFRTRGPGYLVFVDGWIGIPLALAFKGDCPFCVRWAAAAGGGGFLRLWRGHHIAGNFSWQLSALRDASVILFPNQPNEGAMRLEIQAPVVTFRHFWPVTAGSSWSQSTDFYLDFGPSVTWVDGHTARYGGFASFSVAPRVFP
jgi:hypothetical protein